jgi:hypothetical protein
LEEINQTQQAGANQGKSHFGRNAILSALVLGLVVFGGGATYYLMQQNQVFVNKLPLKKSLKLNVTKNKQIGLALTKNADRYE